jgi:hypothetical protein
LEGDALVLERGGVAEEVHRKQHKDEDDQGEHLNDSYTGFI